MADKTGIRVGGLTVEELNKLHPAKPRSIDDPIMKKIIDEIASGTEHERVWLKEMMNKSLPELYASGPFGRPAPDIRQFMPVRSEPPPQKKQKLARKDQLTKERCQVAAKLIWKADPTLTIADVASHPHVDNLDITGGRNFDQRTVRDWVAEAYPKNQPKQKGRPRKKLK